MAITSPAQQLDGITLNGGWRVIQKIPDVIKVTGGYFSVAYIVENAQGQRAFLKALDFTKALGETDPSRILQAMTEAFNFERDLLKACKQFHMDRVVIALNDGSTTQDSANPYSVVQYIIFELADGNVRSQVRNDQKFEVAWALRSLHHIATGLSQLHGKGIAHQDLKPSNVLVFKGSTSKLGDLGRAASRAQLSPHEENTIPGDLTYAPFEQLYRFLSSDWYRRRIGADAYLMGSMIVFFFTGVGMTALTLNHLDEAFNWRKWQGTYEEVMPYLRVAFELALGDFVGEIPEELKIDLTEMVRELCEPDPSLRGHPRDRSVPRNQYSMERYISKLNLLATRAEMGLIGKS